jgi:hypothetical protein
MYRALEEGKYEFVNPIWARPENKAENKSDAKL